MAATATTQKSAPVSPSPPLNKQQKLLHQRNPQKIRNIAIIAHVDHGKTTLVDCLLRQSGIAFNQERAMDSNALQQQRGITILSKCTSVTYQGYKINIVDTPGHSDFGGEVERIMSMVDGVCLVVCATEGPMPQTKFVLSKALQQNLKPIVVINKVDRETSRVSQVENEIFDLFCSLNAQDSLLDYPQIYASAKNGWATSSLDKEKKDSVEDLLNAVIETVSPPQINSTPQDDLVMLVSQTESNPIFGKTLIGRIYSGSIGVGDRLHSVAISQTPSQQQKEQNLKTVESGRIIKVLKRYGTKNIELSRAYAGDIVSIAGFPKSTATHTINTIGKFKRIPSIPIDPPMISMTININNSPIQGKDGTKFTLIQMREWLTRQAENDVSLFLQNDPQNKNIIRLKGRGDLHLGILIQKMRRDGFELAIEPPEVITKLDGAGKILQPIEKFSLECDLSYMNKIVEKMMPRKGELISSQQIGSGDQRIKLIFTIPSRGLIGLKANVIQQTKGNCIIQSQFIAYQSYRGEIVRNSKGAIISTSAGVTSAYALKDVQTKGMLFVGPGADTYQGMVIGEHVLDSDIEMNPAKTKKLTNIRAAGTDENIRLQTPRIFSLEDAVAYIRDDQLLEVTPKALRIRKQILNTNERRKKKREEKNKKK